ncbi:MAG: twin-arginine translocase subunit TatC [Burkholderiales bacterium]|nr:twin-arginine translocase subunit TatC [Burkholderiales bacterium]
MQEDLQPLIEHLIELRSRIVRIAIGVLVAFLPLYFYRGELFHLVALPLMRSMPSGSQMIATDVTGTFFVPMKVAGMAAFLITLPHTLYQAWAFIAPGLYKHEKQLILPVIVSSIALFVLGMCFAYFLVFPVVFGFMAANTPTGVAMMTDIEKYLSFIMGMFLAFGVTFETPVVVVVLVRMGVVSVAKLKEARPYVIVASFVIAAVVTPPDVLSQTMLAVPLWLLYELGVFVSSWAVKPKEKVTETV